MQGRSRERLPCSHSIYFPQLSDLTAVPEVTVFAFFPAHKTDGCVTDFLHTSEALSRLEQSSIVTEEVPVGATGGKQLQCLTAATLLP